MKPVFAGHCERSELRVAKTDKTCWSWQERDGSPEPQCTRVIGKGETYMVHTIYPGHDSGYADGGWRQKLVWVNNEITWQREVIKPHPISSYFCLPCCERWLNLEEALTWIREHQ